MKKLFLLSLLVVCSLSFANFDSSKYYRIRAKHNSKVLDASSNDNIHLVGLHTSYNQQFKIESVGGGYYRIVARHNGKVFDASGSDNIYLNKSHGKDNQLFKFESKGGGYYQIKAKHNNKVFDASGSDNIYLNKSHGKDNQLFKVEAMKPNSHINVSLNKSYKIIVKSNGKVLDASSSDNIQVVDAHGGQNQKFRLDPINNGFYHIRSRKNEKVLDASGSGKGNIYLNSLHGGKNQRFAFEPVGSGYYRIRVGHNGFVLDVDSKNNVYVNNWHGGDNQRFKIEEVQELPDNVVQIFTFNFPLFSDTTEGIEATYKFFEGKDYDSLPQQNKRIERFVEKIKNLNAMDRPTVITLQEVWKDEYKRKLRDSLRSHYPYSFLDTSNPERNISVYNSGLMILSQHPIEGTFGETYSDRKGDDVYADKGIRGIRTTVAGKRVFIFTTHLQSQSKEAHNQIKLNQLEQAKKFIYGAMGNDSLVLLTGDFNLSEEKTPDTLQKARKIFINDAQNRTMTDTYDQSKGNPSIKASTWKSYNSGGAHKIDHAWILQHIKLSSAFSYVIDNFDYNMSDHLALKVKITIE